MLIPSLEFLIRILMRGCKVIEKWKKKREDMLAMP